MTFVLLIRFDILDDFCVVCKNHILMPVIVNRLEDDL